MSRQRTRASLLTAIGCGVPTSVHAATGLGALEGLQYIFFAVLVLLYLLIAGLTFLCLFDSKAAVIAAVAAVFVTLIVPRTSLVSFTRVEVVDNEVLKDWVELGEQQDSEYYPLRDGRLFRMVDRYAYGNSCRPGRGCGSTTSRSGATTERSSSSTASVNLASSRTSNATESSR